VKNPSLGTHRLLVVQPINPALQPTGKRLICTDCVGAGAGEVVYWCRGREAGFPFLPADVPTDANVVAIVDEINVQRKK
jgi:microcompartment protein CcmK/EutM